ncbi:MAG: peptide ABC transporter substrate-binding protein, partial [Microbacterium sp.]
MYSALHARPEGAEERTMMFKIQKMAVVGIAAALALTGCAAGTTGSGGDEEGDTLRLGVVTPVSSFAAWQARWANESPYMQAVYDSLLTASPENEIEANLATKWEYNDDNTELTLTLRDDVTFSDGSALTAEDAAASLLGFRDGGASDSTVLASVTDATAVDATTLKITLAEPNPALLTYLTQNAGLVAPAELAGDDAAATKPVGSGPYVLDTDATVVGSSYVFTKNEDYWNPDRQHYDELVLSVYTDPTALLNAVQGKQVDVTTALDLTTVPQMEAAGYTSYPVDLNWAGFLLSDREGTVTPALGDVKVRQAINYALDRDALSDAIGGGYGTPTAQIFPTFSPSYDESLDALYAYDPEKARDLLAEAGYADGFEVTMPRGVFPAASFTLLGDQLAQVGITVNWDDVQLNDYISNLVGGKYPMSFFQLQQDPSDWQLAQFQIAPTSTWNTFHVSTPE